LRAIAQNGTGSRAEAAPPATTGVSDEQQVLLSTLPPSRGQKRLALGLVLVLLAAFFATLPFATCRSATSGSSFPHMPPQCS
jgi:hypothetical protein